MKKTFPGAGAVCVGAPIVALGMGIPAAWADTSENGAAQQSSTGAENSAVGQAQGQVGAAGINFPKGALHLTCNTKKCGTNPLVPTTRTKGTETVIVYPSTQHGQPNKAGAKGSFATATAGPGYGNLAFADGATTGLPTATTVAVASGPSSMVIVRNKTGLFPCTGTSTKGQFVHKSC